MVQVAFTEVCYAVNVKQVLDEQNGTIIKQAAFLKGTGSRTPTFRN